MDRPLANRGYDRYFAELLRKQLLERQARAPHAVHVDFARRPKQLREIDDWFTGPVCGFGNAENYYRLSSSAPLLPEIRVPTLILAAADDPLVPRHIFDSLHLSSSTILRIARHGGHLGFIGARGADPDRRWLDWRVVDWVMQGRSTILHCDSLQHRRRLRATHGRRSPSPSRARCAFAALDTPYRHDNPSTVCHVLTRQCRLGQRFVDLFDQVVSRGRIPGNRMFDARLQETEDQARGADAEHLFAASA